jgi:hypothetical protein
VELDVLSAAAPDIKAVAMPRGPQRIHFFSRLFHFKRNYDSIKAMTTFYRDTDEFGFR